MVQGGDRGGRQGPTLSVSWRSDLLVLEGSGPETAQLRRVFSKYGSVCVASNVNNAQHLLSTNPALAAGALTWSSDNGRLLQDQGWAARPGSFPLLVVCSFPTVEVVQQVFYAQQRGHLDIRLVCAPLKDDDVALFVASGIHRNRSEPPPPPPDLGAMLGRRLGLTSREVEVLRCALSGIDRRSMTRTLAVRQSTLRTHARAILGKFMVRYPQFPVRNLVELANVLLRQAPELAREDEVAVRPHVD